MNIGDERNQLKCSGKFLFAPAATPTAFIDFGNVMNVKPDTKVERAKFYTVRKGHVEVTAERVTTLERRFSFKVNEHLDQLTKLLEMASQGADQVQASGEDVAYSVASVQQGRTYSLGALDISNLTVSVGATLKTVNVDYTYDAGTGMITILEGGAIANGDTISGTYDKGAVTQSDFTPDEELVMAGNAKIFLFDEETEVPRLAYEGAVEVSVSDRGDWDHTKITEVTVDVLCTGKPTVRKYKFAS